MNAHGFQLDDSLAGVIASESLDGRRTLLDDIRTGYHAKLVLSERAHSQTSRREAGVMEGDMEIREVGRMSAEGFHFLWQKHGLEEMNGDDVFEFHARHNPEMRTHYVPNKTCVFFPAAQTNKIIQASKYTPARA